MRHLLFLIVFSLLSTMCFSQNPEQQKLKIFIDCRVYCDENYIKSNTTFVDFVTDRVASDVHILLTSVVTGSGGKRMQLIFFGQNNYKSRTDTLIYNELPNATNAETRIQIAKRIRLGLIPFLSKTATLNVANKNSNDVSPQKKTDTLPAVPEKINPSSQGSQTKDKWNYWVYKIGGDGSYSADQNYKSSNINSYITANRTTDKLKVNFSISANNNNSTYKYEDNGMLTSYKVKNNSFFITHYLYKSLSDHWSVGYDAEVSNSTFSNYKSKKYVSAGVEYAIFPYKLVDNKFFAVSYHLAMAHNNYYDTTIFNQTSEWLSSQKLKARVAINQKWGYVNAGVTYSNFFKDWKLNNLLLSLDVNIRITGGLSFYVYSYGGLVHDQVYLVKGNASVQDILTRRRQLQSSFNFYSGIGITYRFGSILNNFVNPRFSN